MEYSEFPAPPPLDEIVHCFWFLRGDVTRPEEQPEGQREGQPIVSDGRIEIILHLADPFVRMAGGSALVQASALVAGQLTAPLHVAPTGVADVVGIRFRTAMASSVLRLPLAEITNRVESLRDFMPALSDTLRDAACSSDDPRVRVAALSRALSRLVSRVQDPLATAAIGALNAAGAPSVGAIAHRMGVSARTFERRIADHTGLAPAVLRRTLRFRRAFRLLDTAPSKTWSRVAVQAGYFDQAHLIREFRRFAGSPPSAFFGHDASLARAFIGTDLS